MINFVIPIVCGLCCHFFRLTVPSRLSLLPRYLRSRPNHQGQNKIHHPPTAEGLSDMPSSSTSSSSSAAVLKTLSPSRVKNLLLALSLFCMFYLLLSNHRQAAELLRASPVLPPQATPATPTSRRHLLFAVASSSVSFPRRGLYLRLWYSPNSVRALAFLDRLPGGGGGPVTDLPPTLVSEDTSRFPYTFPGGLRSAIRVARVVKEAVDRGEAGIRWYVFGDDDTVFFVDNLVSVLSKYDHTKWYYVGSNSESYEQNVKYSFDMAFGGGGFAITRSLAVALARVLDSCLVRYSHLYGSDARIFSCLAELGVGLTHEPGFHQVDVRGDLFGFLTAHPLSPLLSLHHLDAVDPIFPNLNRTQALELLFEAVNVDPARVLQQSVCYDRMNSLTISVAWGYAVRVFEGNELLPDLLAVQRTFKPWRKSMSTSSSHYMFNMREFPKDPCRRPVTFFLHSILSDENGIQSNYGGRIIEHCIRGNTLKNLKKITVFSRKLGHDIEQMKALRRQCCDVLPIVNGSMVIHIRQCGDNELISMY